jgi:hypothetical protein
MNEREQTDWLDLQLREAAPYIDDDGFTRRVLQRLPARRHVQSFRAVVLIGMTLLASLITYFLSDGGRFIVRNVVRLTILPPLTLLILAVTSGMLVTALGLVAALSKTRDLQS